MLVMLLLLSLACNKAVSCAKWMINLVKYGVNPILGRYGLVSPQKWWISPLLVVQEIDRRQLAGIPSQTRPNIPEIFSLFFFNIFYKIIVCRSVSGFAHDYDYSMW